MEAELDRSRAEAAQRDTDSERKKVKSQNKWALAMALIGVVGGGFFTITSTLLDKLPGLHEGSSQSVCGSAYANVSQAVREGIRKQVLLERINSDDVDSQCGEESVILAEILDAPRRLEVASSQSVCASAYANVSQAVREGIRKQVLLERINPDDVDSQCGKESVILADIIDGDR
ncbi:hypothetical protein AB0E69_14720 [Kribbella sp. NPDC026611]|uniref:hypothetical protein n=1 Tax=Kribbella sp. NPDC026611 TaxID=3154911 RepID=UPI0033ED039C